MLLTVHLQVCTALLQVGEDLGAGRVEDSRQEGSVVLWSSGSPGHKPKAVVVTL